MRLPRRMVRRVNRVRRVRRSNQLNCLLAKLPFIAHQSANIRRSGTRVISVHVEPTIFHVRGKRIAELTTGEITVPEIRLPDLTTSVSLPHLTDSVTESRVAGQEGRSIADQRVLGNKLRTAVTWGVIRSGTGSAGSAFDLGLRHLPS
jgi:hypothetical protein